MATVMMQGWDMGFVQPPEDGHANATAQAAAAWASALSTGAPVLAWTSSSVTPGASSSALKVPPRLARDVEHAEVGDDPVDHAGAGQRQRAALQELVLAVLRGVLHHHDHALDAGDQVHRAAHALDHLAGDHPVGEVAVPATCIAPRIDRSMWPPRIIAKLSAELRSSWSSAAR